MHGTAIVLWVCLMVGNFIWQTLTKRDWERAADRSFFQGVALVAFLLATTGH